MVHSHPVAVPPTTAPANPAARQTASYVSRMTSATICSSTQRRPSRTASHGDVRRYNSSNAARSPFAKDGAGAQQNGREGEGRTGSGWEGLLRARDHVIVPRPPR